VEYTLDKKRGKYKPKEENVRKLMAFLEKENTQNLSVNGNRRIKNPKQ
jgi:hypothetical protein